MPHNDFAFRDEHGQPGNATVPEPSILRQLDLAASQGIDGDNGGTWNPASPIILGGAGLNLSGYVLANGGVTTGPLASPRALIVSGVPAVWLAGNRTRIVVFPLRDFGARFDETTIYQASTVTYDDGSSPGTVTTLQNTGLFSLSTTTVRLIVPIPQFRCTVGNVSAGTSWFPTLRIRTGQSSVPSLLTGMPGFRLSKFTAAGAWQSSQDVVIPTWAATHAYNVGDLVIPTSPNSRQFRCTVGGTSGGAQPAGFPAAVVGTTIAGDGGVSWLTELGPAGATAHYITLPLPTTAANYFAQGQWQDITFPGNITSSGLFFLGGPGSQQTNFFVLDILDKSGTNNLFHSLRLSLTSATFAPSA